MFTLINFLPACPYGDKDIRCPSLVGNRAEAMCKNYGHICCKSCSAHNEPQSEVIVKSQPKPLNNNGNFPKRINTWTNDANPVRAGAQSMQILRPSRHMISTSSTRPWPSTVGTTIHFIAPSNNALSPGVNKIHVNIQNTPKVPRRRDRSRARDLHRTHAELMRTLTLLLTRIRSVLRG